MKKLPDTLTDKERASLLKQPNYNSLTGLRDAVIIRLMLNAGLRCGEVLSLSESDIDWDNRKIFIRNGKGGKSRFVWISERDMYFLYQWKLKKPDSDLFITTLKGGKVSDRQVRAMVKRRAQKAGISKDVHPHLLRHSFATDLLKKTKNIRLVQKALGHSNLATTMIYTHVYDEELEEAFKALRAEDVQI